MFFDRTVIPLAKKLANCGVLGDSAEELLDNAVTNREEWEIQGHEIVELYVAHYRETHVRETRDSDDSVSGNNNNDGDGTATSLSRNSLRKSVGGLEPNPFPKSIGGLEAHPSRTSISGLLTSDAEVTDPTDQLATSDRTDNVGLSHDGTAPPTPGTPGGLSVQSAASTDGTGSYDDGDGASSGDPDPDVVYAVLDNLDEPDDFDSYVLLTPSQLRKREDKKRRTGNDVRKALSDRRRRRRMASSITSSRRASSAMISVGSRRSIYSSSYSANLDDESDDSAVGLEI